MGVRDVGIGRWGVEGGDGWDVTIEKLVYQCRSAEGDGSGREKADGNRGVGSDAGRNEVYISAAIT